MWCDITLPDVTALATYSRNDPDVSTFDQRLQLGQSEILGVGIKRITMDQLELAASGYFDGEDEFATAVHESRKAIKRIRALLRLVRPELTDRVYGYEDHTMRDTARLVGEVRSVVAVTEAALSIRNLYGELLADGTFDELAARLLHRRELNELQALEDPNLVGLVVRNLEKAYHRYSSWPTDLDTREVYGLGIRDKYSSIEHGLHSTYGRGRRQMVVAYTTPSDENFHRWRRNAKYLRYQIEFLAPLWPEVVVGMATTLDRLGLVLGEDHDLAELLALLRTRPDLCPNPRERSLFSALVTQRKTELQFAAEILGRRIYAEKPSSLQHRFGEYWESRKMALNAPLDTITVY